MNQLIGDNNITLQNTDLDFISDTETFFQSLVINPGEQSGGQFTALSNFDLDAPFHSIGMLQVLGASPGTTLGSATALTGSRFTFDGGFIDGPFLFDGMTAPNFQFNADIVLNGTFTINSDSGIDALADDTTFTNNGTLLFFRNSDEGSSEINTFDPLINRGSLVFGTNSSTGTGSQFLVPNGIVSNGIDNRASLSIDENVELVTGGLELGQTEVFLNGSLILNEFRAEIMPQAIDLIVDDGARIFGSGGIGFASDAGAVSGTVFVESGGTIAPGTCLLYTSDAADE